MTVTEPEWTEEDQAWAIALLQLEADTCPGCGQPLSQSTLPAAEGEYEVPAPTRCHCCTTLHVHQERYAEAKPGLMFEAQPRRSQGRG